jgi:hypothetical protein
MTVFLIDDDCMESVTADAVSVSYSLDGFTILHFEDGEEWHCHRSHPRNVNPWRVHGYNVSH